MFTLINTHITFHYHMFLVAKTMCGKLTFYHLVEKGTVFVLSKVKAIRLQNSFAIVLSNYFPIGTVQFMSKRLQIAEL